VRAKRLSSAKPDSSERRSAASWKKRKRLAARILSSTQRTHALRTSTSATTLHQIQPIQSSVAPSQCRRSSQNVQPDVPRSLRRRRRRSRQQHHHHHHQRLGLAAPSLPSWPTRSNGRPKQQQQSRTLDPTSSTKALTRRRESFDLRHNKRATSLFSLLGRALSCDVTQEKEKPAGE
jgi:hypothetical protein